MSTKDDSVFLPNEEGLTTQETVKEFEAAFCEFRAEIVPYNKDETRKMIEWIVNNQNFHLVEGDTIWKRMEASGLFEERSWKSMRAHFHENVLSLLGEIKVSPDVKWKLEACLKNPDALEFLCDADMDSESEPSSKKMLVDKVMRKTKPKDSKTNRNESSDGDDQRARTTVKRFVRKRSKIPADKFDESIRLSSFSTRSSIESSKENKVDNGVEPRIEALLNNSNIPQNISQLRDSSGASKSLDISKPTIDKSIPEVPDVSHSNNPHEKLENDAGRFVDDVPTITEFSAGLKEAGSRGMSQERERSLMGVTSTIRNDEDDPLSVCNRTRKSAEAIQPAPEPDTPKRDSTVETPPRIIASSQNSKDEVGDELDEERSENSGGDTESFDDYGENIDGLPNGVRKIHKLEAQLGTDDAEDVYLVIKGLPRNIDFENVNFVRTSRNLPDPDVNDNSANPEPEKKKLKVICLDSCNNKSKDWKNKGPYGEKFRTPYSKEEDLSIITFLKDWKTKKGDLSLGGNRVWKIMEKKTVCKGRTWESMKERWRGYLTDNLDKFNIDNI